MRILLHVFQHMLHDIIDIFNFNYFKSFTSDDVFEIIKVKKHTRIKVFLIIKEV